MARTKTSYASNSGAGKTLGQWGHSSRHAEERLSLDDYTAFIGDAVSGGVNVPDVNLALRGRGSAGSSWDHPQSYWLTNKSGGTRAAGDVVVVDTGNDDAYTTTTAADNPLVIGIVEASTANNASGPVMIGGRIASVSVTAATRGQYLGTSTTGGKAVSSATITAGTFGIALTSAAGGFCKALLFPMINRLPPASSITNGMILDGTLTYADLSATAGIYAGQTDASVARQNLLINPGFETWLAGTSFTNANLTVTTEIPTATGWNAYKGTGGTTLTVDRDSTTVKTNSTYSAKIVQGSFVGGSQFISWLPDPAQLRGQLVTFSIDVYSTVASSCRISIYYNGTGAGHQFGSYHTGSGWERLTKTATVSNNAGIVGADVWLDKADTFYLDNAMFTYGSYSSEYIPESPGIDTAKIMLQTPGQIAFPVTQQASAGANTLDDYEEGTWTPSLGGTPTAATYGANRKGTYTKVGRMVYLHCDMDVDQLNNGSAHSVTSGCPFTTAVVGGGAASYWLNAASNFTFLGFAFVNSNTYPSFVGTTAAQASITAQPTVFTNGSRAVGSIVYEV